MNHQRVSIYRRFWLIVLLVLVAIFYNLPPVIPLKLHLGNINVDTTINKPLAKFGRDLKFGLDLAGGASLTYDIDTGSVSPEALPQALESLKSNIERRINLFGVSEATVQTSSQLDNYRLIIELPGVEEVDQAIALIGQTAQLSFRGETPVAPEATPAATFYDYFSDDVGLNGSHLERSVVQINPQNGQPEVSLEFDQEGAQLFKMATEKYQGKRIAIFLDNTPITFPVVQSVIPDGRAVINGNFDNQTAKALSAQLNAGALPLSISLVSQNRIGATLGQSTINRGVFAGAVGLILVSLFMIGNYGKLGLIADIGLLIYGLITLSLYRLIPVTLTFPGVVGFILSVGMAVDSNILIFERMREEIRRGKPYNVALELGFGRAWDSIKDANICTVITALILFNPLNWSFLNSSGMIRGFAVTLLLGIIVSIFTGVYVTRNLLRVFAGKKETL